MKKFANKGLVFALISAFLYAFNVIIEKKYITYISSETILFLMYIGSGVGLLIIHLLTQKKEKSNSDKITKNEVPAIITIVLCELIASLLTILTSFNVTLNLDILTSIFNILSFPPRYSTNLLASILKSFLFAFNTINKINIKTPIIIKY